MLTDIFAERYSSRVMWDHIGHIETKLLTQSFRIVVEQLFPTINGMGASTTWRSPNGHLSMTG